MKASVKRSSNPHRSFSVISRRGLLKAAAGGLAMMATSGKLRSAKGQTKLPYESPMINQVDLPNILGPGDDPSQPLLAQRPKASGVTGATAFPKAPPPYHP